jgi:CRP/FNR family cyclic AMP-dependent transcriptional regulator
VTLFRPDEFLVLEDDWANDLFFILTGRVPITITGFKVAERGSGQHVGEMALIDPSQPRSASAIATEPTVALVVSEGDFAAVAAHHPDMWRQMAKDIAERLRQRKKFVRPSNPVPFIFIACASESLSVAKAIQRGLEANDAVIEVWTDGTFKPSEDTMESLENKLVVADFAIAIFSPDDQTKSRGEDKLAPRDNTVFELGLFAGAIGRNRSFYAVSKASKVKIPSDLAGITLIRYSTDKQLNVSEAVEAIQERIKSLGPR